LDDIGLGDAIPRHAPSHRPAVAGAGDPAVHEIDAAVRHRAIVNEESGRPALMRLDATASAAKRRVEDHIRPGLETAGPDKVFVVARDGAAIDQNLTALDAEVAGLRCPKVG